MGELAPRQNHRKAKSRLEALLALASGSVAQPVAGIAGGLSGLLTGNAGNGARTVQATQQALTYAPRDPSSLEAVGRAVEPVTARLQKLRDYLGDKTLAHTGSPALATAGYMVPDTLLTLLGARGAGVKGPKLAQILERSEGPTMGSPVAQIGAIRAYHGSPHDFDRFSMANIGTGEGAQAYGHGLYFAGNKGVAQGYRDNLTTSADAYLDGVHVNDLPTAERSAVRMLQDAGGSYEAAMRAAKADMLRSGSDGAEFHVDRYNTLRDAQLGKRKIDAPPGRLYNVELAPDEADLLDWDAPLSQQPEKVQPVLREMLTRARKSFSGIDPNGNPTAGQVHHLYTQHRGGNSAAVTEFLRDNGIPGIRYLDGGSRAAGDGSRNYVMFDDSLIKIQGKE